VELFAPRQRASLEAAGAEPGTILDNAYGYGLFTGGLGLHYGGERVAMTVLPARWRRRPWAAGADAESADRRQPQRHGGQGGDGAKSRRSVHVRGLTPDMSRDAFVLQRVSVL
jgi:hypothetical protein